MEIGTQETRFGVLAVKRGFVTPAQVVEALAVQVAEDLSKRRHRPIGEILLEQEAINSSQLDLVLADMGRPMKMA
jgi:hypothetical protein